MQNKLKSELRLFSKSGFTLSELILALIVSAVVMMAITGIYNFQTKMFNKMLSSWQINDDLSIILATFKRYTTVGKKLLYCSPTEVRIRIEEDGVEMDVYWRLTPKGEILLGMVPPGGGYGSELLLSPLVFLSQSSFSCWSNPETNISGITVRLTLVDKYGQIGQRISKYRLILTGGNV